MKMTHLEVGRLGGKAGALGMKQRSARLEEEYNKNPRLCRACGKPISYRKKVLRNQFCNHSCVARYVNRSKVQHSLRKCLGCNDVVRYKKYCGHPCLMAHKESLLIANVDSGKASGLTGKTNQMAGSLRRAIIKRANNRCSTCGWAEIHPVTGLVPLHVHHEDGNYKNNVSSNLRVLCPNCHSLTPTFGALNKTGRRRNGDM